MIERYIRQFNENDNIDDEKQKTMKPYHDKTVHALSEFYKHGKTIYGDSNILKYIYDILKESLPEKLVKDLVD